MGWGGGRNFTPLPDVEARADPGDFSGIHVATGPAYQALGRSLTFTDSSRKINGFQAFVRALGEWRSARAASAFSANDFESVVFSQHPQLKNDAGQVAETRSAAARMTGSGSAFFAALRFAAERDRARRVLEGDRVFRGVPRHAGQPGEPAQATSGCGAGNWRSTWRPRSKERISYGRPKAGTPTMRFNHFKVFSGNANPALAAEICYELGCQLGARSTSSSFPTAKCTCRSRKTCAAPTFSWCSPPARRWTAT